MATDARIAVGLPAHPKTKKLIKRLGQGAAWNLVCLFLWTAANRSDGDLADMSVEDIELAADWAGDDGAFVAALTDVRFLDCEAGGEFRIHDWDSHNPWAAGAEQRSFKARWNAAKRHHGEAEADRLVPEYAAIRNASSKADSKTPADAPATGSKATADEQESPCNAPSPSPSPSPIPSYPSSLRSEGVGPSASPTPPPTPEKLKGKKPQREQIPLAVYLESCKAARIKPIPDDHSIKAWATDAGIVSEMMQITWVLFRERYTLDERAKGKRYKDWPGHFANAVKGNWFKLWYTGDDGRPAWSTVGMTHKAALDARLAQKEAVHG